MELTKEVIEAQGLSTDQVTAINTEFKTGYDSGMTTLKTEYEGAANKNAEGILSGAAKKVTAITGVERNQGEQYGDFIDRSWVDFSGKEQKELSDTKASYESKIKDFKGDETVLKELGEFKEANKVLKGKEAEWDKVINSGVQKNYEDLLVKNTSLNQSVAFGSVKPSFDKDANVFEVDAKWKGFISATMEKNDIVMHEGVAYAVNKENDLIKTKLEDLVKENEEITSLVNGRQQDPLKTKQANLKDVDGISFKVPKDATTAELGALVQEQLSKDGVANTDANYGTQFQAMYNKAKAGQKTAA